MATGILASEETKPTLKEMLLELKINNKILNEVHDLTVNEQDVERE